ncbi:MAG: amino acid decarboxylase [Clostridia bacterium]|nr:amino acid decarboxylase [Clostridia bacterium]
MNTPICDFVDFYKKSGALRLHMPGHKGKNILGAESSDITEIKGADSLYEAEGIIAESEQNASKLFGCPTYYSTEGSSHCIRAMLYLAMINAKSQGARPRIAAARNVHKTFLGAAAMLDLDVSFMFSEESESYLSFSISAEAVERFLSQSKEKITAVYITAPDYLGSMISVGEIAHICHRYDVLLLVDNAHGAYLRFLKSSLHPIDHGADICCSSAHKTLPVLTGGAYLHISNRLNDVSAAEVKNALSLFGSTSPSYLILQSLDAANKYIAEGYGHQLESFCKMLALCKEKLSQRGYVFFGEEPLKLTVCTKKYGYTGYELESILHEKGIACEFADPDYLVMMFTPQNGEGDITKLTDALLSIPGRQEISEKPPVLRKADKIMRIREAIFSEKETVEIHQSLGRILASPGVSCPPAVPIIVCGEKINEEAIKCFDYYGIKKLDVVK